MSEHPIQRWTFGDICAMESERPAGGWESECGYVTYDDHLEAVRQAEQRERKRVISEVDKLACGVSFYNLLDEQFFFKSLHAMKTGKL